MLLSLNVSHDFCVGVLAAQPRNNDDDDTGHCDAAGFDYFAQGPHPPPSTFHLTAFDASTCTAATLAGNFALLRIMRTRVFVTELKVKGDIVKVKGDIDELDTSSRHILGLSEWSEHTY